MKIILVLLMFTASEQTVRHSAEVGTVEECVQFGQQWLDQGIKDQSTVSVAYLCEVLPHINEKKA